MYFHKQLPAGERLCPSSATVGRSVLSVLPAGCGTRRACKQRLHAYQEELPCKNTSQQGQTVHTPLGLTPGQSTGQQQCKPGGLPSRRQAGVFLTLLTAGVAASPIASSASHADVPLVSRISSPTLQNPGYALPWAPRQLYYPRWMFGEWEVTSQMVAASAPLGSRFLPSSAPPLPDDPLAETPLSYRLRFFATLPDTWENQVRVMLGLLPLDAIIGDRAFNTTQLTNASLGYEAVQRVLYDPRDSPGRQTVEFRQVGPDMRPLPPRRVELFFNNVLSEVSSSDDGTETVVTSELTRQVLLGVQQADVRDYEVINQFTLSPEGAVHGKQRVVLYLQPQDRLYFDSRGAAIAVYDYKLELKRVPPPEDAAGAFSCVATPKDVIQCI